MRELPARSKAAAGAVGAKSARACDRCLVRRARWYCAADDAFLCQLCDSSVHLANSVARRHERVRIKTSTSSSKWSKEEGRGGGEEPAWHQGFRRKARTPRGGGGAKVAKREVADVGGSDTLVPDLDLGSLEDFAAVEEEQLLYRVPILEPVLLSDVCSSPTPSSDVAKPHLPPKTAHDNSMAVVLPAVVKSDVEISDFEMAEVESFLRRGLGGGDNAYSMEELGLMVEEDYGVKSIIPVVKKEEEVDVDLHREEAPMVKLDWGSPREEIKPLVVDGEKVKKRKRRRTNPIELDLNYEGVMSSWNKQEASPWVDGSRPQLDLDNWSPDFTCGGGVDVEGARTQGGGEGESGYWARAGGGGGGDDGGREARVLRYKEKRRTRLFSKKIRYEVRKLNAEKRPRMKGRFVKRASLLSNTTAAADTTISGDHGVVPQPQYVF